MLIMLEKPEYLRGQVVNKDGLFWKCCSGECDGTPLIVPPTKRQLIFAGMLDAIYDLLGLILGTPTIEYKEGGLLPYLQVKEYKIIYFTDTARYRVFNAKQEKVFAGRYKELERWLQENI